jgi:pimeloyl-ACP methyl ester carboxylesterase
MDLAATVRLQEMRSTTPESRRSGSGNRAARRRQAPRQSVVLVHGLWMPGWETLLLQRRLTRAGFRTRLFTYRAVKDDPEGLVRRLLDFIDDTRGDVVHLLGHSLGGILAIKACTDHDPARLGRIVCLGSPLAGSHACRRLARLPGGRRLLGRSLRVLEDAVVPRWCGATELGVIAGSHGIGGGQLLGGLPRPHDGTVAVDETHLEGETDHRVLPVSHLSMLLSKRVADEVARFFETGLFGSQ